MTALNLSAPRTRSAATAAAARPGLLARAAGALRRGGRAAVAAAARAAGPLSYTARMLRAGHQVAAGITSIDTETGARELAGRKMARIFQNANLRTPRNAEALRSILTPACLSYIARQVATNGHACLLMVWRGPNDGYLAPIEDWTIDEGGVDPRTWLFQLSVPSPSGTVTDVFTRADVFYVVQDPDPTEPWYGTSAGGSVAAAAVPAAARKGLWAEHKMPVNRLVPVPKMGGKGDSEKDKARKSMEQGLQDGGFVAFPQSTQSGFTDRGQAPQRDWDPRRMGPEPTQPQVDSYFRSEGLLMAAHGVHPSLIDAKATATAIREARRQTQEEADGIARLIEAEAMRMFGVPVGLWWHTADDVELIRARTAAELVKQGVDPAQALAAAGFGESFTITKPPPPKPAPTPPKNGGPPDA